MFPTNTRINAPMGVTSLQSFVYVYPLYPIVANTSLYYKSIDTVEVYSLDQFEIARTRFA